MSELGGDLQVPTKVCGNCSVQSETNGDFCPHCGRSYIRRGVSKRTKLLVVGVAAVLLLGGASTAAVGKIRQDRAAEVARIAAQRQARAEAKAEAARRAEAARKVDAKKAADDAERRQRRRWVREMEATITKDAKKDVAKGYLQGPIYYTSCDPLGGGSTDDLTALTTTFDCIVVTEKHGDGTVSGYDYSATENWSKGSYTWQLNN